MNPRAITLGAGLRLAMTLAWALCAFGAAAWAASAGEAPLNVVEIRLLPQAEVQGTRYTLGEVAELDGFDMELVRRLSGITLGRSPRPGARARLNLSQVRSRLYRKVKPETVHLVMPQPSWIIRASQVVSGQEISRMVKEKATVLGGGKDTGLTTTVSGPVRDAVLPLGAVQWNIQPLGRKVSAAGDRTFSVSARVDGRQAWRGMVRVKQALIRDVVVASRPIHRGQLIGKGDVKVERQNLSGKRSGRYAMRLEDVVGRHARRPIAMGEWIHGKMTNAPSDVREGGRVTLVYRTPRLFFHTPGVALVQGRVGDFIPVRNLQSGKIVHGVVQNATTVKVN